MADAYTRLVGNPVGDFVARNLGLPRPVELDRFVPGAPLIDGRVLVGAAAGGRCGEAVAAVLAEAGTAVDSRLGDEVRGRLGSASIDAGVWNGEAPGDQRWKALVFDATGIAASSALWRALGFLPPGDPPARAERPADRDRLRPRRL